MQAWRLGSYELIRPLGEGGMAQVYLARDVRLGREVAVKVLDVRLAERPGFGDRFLREARVAAALDHPNIVPLYDFGHSDQFLYLVMPYVSGGSLQDALPRAPFALGEVVKYGAQAADALDYAHQQGVVHRDVKPANMLLHADGRLMLSDFGLAKILDGSPLPAARAGRPDAGTPEYMAPEQVEGRTDERSDIYALGVVLYLLLTGHLPFSGSTSNAVMEAQLYRLPAPPRVLNPQVTPAMQEVVLRALAKHPQDRFQRAGELGAALMGALVAGDVEPLPFALSRPSPTSLPPIVPRTPPPPRTSFPPRSSQASPIRSGLTPPWEPPHVPVAGQSSSGRPGATTYPPHMQRQLSDPRAPLSPFDASGTSPARAYPPSVGQYPNPNAFPQTIPTAAHHAAAAPLSLPRHLAPAPQFPNLSPSASAPPLPVLGVRPVAMRTRSRPRSGVVLWLAAALILMLLSMVLLFTLFH